MDCSICGKSFHYCSSCSPEPCMDVGCCSEACAERRPLVEQLRRPLHETDDDTLLDVAADEIERLQAVQGHFLTIRSWVTSEVPYVQMPELLKNALDQTREAAEARGGNE